MTDRPRREASMEQAVSPLDVCERLRKERRRRDDSDILAELRAMPPLPHERDPGWLRDWRTEPLWHRGYLFDVLAAEVCRRKLKEAVPLLLERACCGDPGEMFRALPECLRLTVRPDWEYLFNLCERALESPHPGARLWAVETLGMLRHDHPEKVRSAGNAAIERAVNDQEELVRDAAESRLSCLREEGVSEPPAGADRPRDRR